MSVASVGAFVKQNRQALLNILGMSMVFSYSVHNYRVKVAWEEREVEFRRLERELERVKGGLASDEWLDRVSESVKVALKQPRLPTVTISQALRAELDKLANPLQRSKEDIVVERMSKAGGGGGAEEMGALIGAIVGGDGSGKKNGPRIV